MSQKIRGMSEYTREGKNEDDDDTRNKNVESYQMNSSVERA